MWSNHHKFSLKHLSDVNYLLGLKAHSSSDSNPHYTHSDQVCQRDPLWSQSFLLQTLLYSSLFKLQTFLICSALFDDASLYRSIIGALQYFTLIRPDLSFSVNKLPQFLQAPTQNHWRACKRVPRYVQGTLSLGLSFSPVSNFRLHRFVDVNYASSINDRRSTTYFCIKLGNNVLSWSSRKQSVVARTSTEV